MTTPRLTVEQIGELEKYRAEAEAEFAKMDEYRKTAPKDYIAPWEYKTAEERNNAWLDGFRKLCGSSWKK